MYCTVSNTTEPLCSLSFLRLGHDELGAEAIRSQPLVVLAGVAQEGHLKAK